MTAEQALILLCIALLLALVGAIMSCERGEE